LDDILSDKKYTEYIALKISCDYLKRKIFLYNNKLNNKNLEKFYPLVDNYEPPLRILFTGPF
jgi:hypothetical protein